MNAQLNPQDAEHRLAHIAPDEDCFEPDPEPDPESDNHHWPGDGSGEDDFADYNANEVNDYRDE